VGWQFGANFLIIAKMTLFIDKNLQTGTIIAYIDSFCHYCRGSSVVERKPEELRVVGSIPTPGTIFHIKLQLA
jgi:hypothetical protein